MINTLAIRIAWRYIFSRKSHSAVNAISIVSVCGVAVATMAIVCVLSVFNGFRGVVESILSRISPDLKIASDGTSLIKDADSIVDLIKGIEGVDAVSAVVSDNALLYRDSRQLPVKIIGVSPEEFAKITDIKNILVRGSNYKFVDGSPNSSDVAQVAENDDVDEIERIADKEFDESALFADVGELYDVSYFDTPQVVNNALLSVGLARQLSLSPQPQDWQTEGVTLFVPRRTSKVNLANPATSFRLDSLGIAGVYESEQNDFDANTLIVDIDVARRLMEYDSQADFVYVALTGDADAAEVKKAIENRLGNGYEVADRFEQEAINFRMVSVEKWITFLLLSFILLIASFNIISTLAMFILEKRKSIRLMTDLGASKSFIGSVFSWESFIICMLGSVAGLLAGLVLCWLQAEFGLIKIGADTSNMIVDAYPVRIECGDIFLVMVPTLLVGLLAALISSAYSKRFV